MSNKLREALEKFSAVDLSGLKFPLDGDSSAIYNSDKKEITIPYWRVAELLNEVKAAQDMAKTALAEPLKNCEVGTIGEQIKRFYNEYYAKDSRCKRMWSFGECAIHWSQMSYDNIRDDANERNWRECMAKIQNETRNFT